MSDHAKLTVATLCST